MGIFSALVGAVSGIGTWFAGLGAAAQAFVQIGAGLAFNAISAALAGRPEAPKEPGIVGELQQGADIPRSFIMGRRATAGSLVYHNEWGDDNELYTRITALSDLPITDLVHIWIDGKRYELDKANPHPDYGWPIVGLSETRTETRSVVIGYNDDYETDIYGTEEVEISETIGWVLFHNGTQTEPTAFVANEVATEERPWSASDIGVGVAQAVTTFKIDREVFQGLPELLFVCDGIAIENPATQANEFTENPLIMAHQIIEGISYGGQWFYGPEQAGRFDPSELTAEIAKCDVPVPGADQMTSEQRIEAFGADIIPARYRASLEVSLDRPPADILEDLLSSCNGRASEVGTRYRLQVGDPAAAVASITDDDILSTEGQSFAPFFPLAETVNAITATYPAPSDGWQQQDAPPLYRPDLEGEDGNRRLPSGVSLPAVPFPEQVQRLMASALAEARRARRHSLVLPSKFWRLEPGDFIDFTSDRNGYADKVFRVDGVSDLPNGDLAIDITEVDPSDYDWAADSDFTNVTSGSLSGVSFAVPSVQGWDFQPFVAPGDDDGSAVAAVVGLWNRPAENTVDRIEIQVRRVGGAELVAEKSVPNVTLGLAPISDGIVRFTGYEGRGRFVSRGRAGPWTSWVATQSPDVRIGATDIGDDVWERIAADNQGAFDRERSIRKDAEDRLAEFDIDDRVTQILETERVDKTVQENKEEIELSLGEAVTRIVNVETQAATTDAALITTEQTLQAQIDGAVSTTQTLTTNLASTDASVAQLTVDVNAGFADVNSSISSVSTALSTAEGALAQDIQTVSTSVGNLNSEIVSTNLSLDGVKNTYSIQIDNNGAASGFALTSTLMGEGGVISDFLVNVDAFRVGNTSNQGDYTAPFTVAGGNTYITKAYIKEADIDRLKIANNSVGFSVISTGAYRVGNGTWQDGSSLVLWLPGGSRCRVKLAWDIDQGYATYPGPTWGFRLKENGIIFKERNGMTFGNDYPSGAVISVEFDVLPVSGGGNRPFTYALEWFGSNNQITATAALAAEVSYK